ncbi:hypothetical protein X801_07154, partial [Opisthorchis viverrini]
STERFCFSKGLITTYWDSRYLGKLNLTNDTHLIVWSLFPRRSTDPPVQRSSSSDWIQMDLQRNSFSGESNSLRLYLDESRILKDCLFNPDVIGEPVPPKTDTFLSTLSNISVHDFNLHSGDSMLSICRMFQDKKTTLVRSLRRVERQTGISVGQTNALPNHLKMPNTNYCGPIYRLDRKRSLGIDSFIQQHMNANLPDEFDKPLGSDQQTDSCCFDHDSCPYNIYSGETKYGLTNTMRVTMSWCACDQ